MEMVDGIPRRIRLDLMTPLEFKIRELMLQVEDLGCHQLLTDAIILLDEAREKIADFVEIPK